MQPQNVHYLPNAAPAPALAAGIRLNPHTYKFRQIALMLGINDKAAAYQVAFVRILIAHQAFPVPLPHVIISRQVAVTGADAVRPGANWQKAAVDAWFDGLLPPGIRADEAAGDDADTLDGNAGNINALVAGRGA